jgi:excisionase family DNA binding protein
MSDLPDLLNIKQAARLLQVSETSLRRWTNAGRLACLRVGRRRERRFRRADLLAFLEEQPASPALAGRAGPREARSPGIGGIPLPSGSHVVALYADDGGRATLAAAFLADGLRPGTVCFLVTAPEARPHILTQLVRAWGPLEREIDDGRLVLSEYAASVPAQYEYFEARFVAAARAGARSFRVVGDVTAFAAAVARGEVLEYEVGFDVVGRRFPVVTLCEYDVRRFSSLDLLNVLKLHEDTFRYPVDRLLA